MSKVSYDDNSFEAELINGIVSFTDRDNKKCDDNRPCMRCVTRMEECVHVERVRKSIKHRCVNCRKNNKKVSNETQFSGEISLLLSQCEDNRPCRLCVEMNVECSDVPRRTSGGTRVRLACATCREVLPSTRTLELRD